jgi:hypothetical protein
MRPVKPEVPPGFSFKMLDHLVAPLGGKPDRKATIWTN